MAKPGLVSNAIYVVFIGTSLVTVIGIFVGEMINEDTFSMISITGIEDVGSFVVILLSWVIAAAVAGFRSKSSYGGALAAFLGTALGTVVIGFVLSGIVVVNPLDQRIVIINESKMAGIASFLLGIVIMLIVSIITGFVTGSLAKEAPEQRATGRSRKSWEASKHESKWKCSRCKQPLKAGQMVCPNCGTPVIE
ncbi:MAG: zinc ribbon domain-containing protein [Candidatus Odinarchaeota archaeon]